MSVRISDRSVTLPISEITTDFYVRKALNDDWVMELAIKISGGVELEPIFVTREKKAVDGRHRLSAHEYADQAEIKCKYVDADNEIELIVFALQCNMGGGLPASKDDIEHTIQGLLDRGVSKKDLVAVLAPMPEKLVKTYLKELESRNKRAKLTKAASAIVDGGLSLGKAAEQYNVDQDELKVLLSGRTRRKGAKNGVGEMQSLFSKTYQAQGSRTAKTLRRLLEMYSDGDVTHKQVLDMFKHLDHLIKQARRAIDGHRKRFDAMEAPKKLAS